MNIRRQSHLISLSHSIFRTERFHGHSVPQGDALTPGRISIQPPLSPADQSRSVLCYLLPVPLVRRPLPVSRCFFPPCWFRAAPSVYREASGLGNRSLRRSSCHSACFFGNRRIFLHAVCNLIAAAVLHGPLKPRPRTFATVLRRHDRDLTQFCFWLQGSSTRTTCEVSRAKYPFVSWSTGLTSSTSTLPSQRNTSATNPPRFSRQVLPI